MCGSPPVFSPCRATSLGAIHPETGSPLNRGYRRSVLMDWVSRASFRRVTGKVPRTVYDAFRILMTKKKRSSFTGSRRGSRRGAVLVEVPCLVEAGEAAQFLQRLIRVLARRPRRLTLRFLTGSLMRPDTALSAYELLARSKPGVRIHAEAISSVLGPGIILFLLADSRAMRSTGMLYLPLPRLNRQEGDPARHLLQDPEAWKEEGEESDSAAWTANVLQVELEAIRHIVEQHLVWNDVTRKPMTFECVRDYGLVGDDRVGSLLRKLEGAHAEEHGDATPRTRRHPKSE